SNIIIIVLFYILIRKLNERSFEMKL
ncbi:TPA: ABC transporter permease, partial [Streptococcus pneumoniae]